MNPMKVGRFTPGTHLPVYEPYHVSSEQQPDYLLILAWNFAREIMASHNPSTGIAAGRFIIPVPRPQVV